MSYILNAFAIRGFAGQRREAGFAMYTFIPNVTDISKLTMISNFSIASLPSLTERDLRRWALSVRVRRAIRDDDMMALHLLTRTMEYISWQ
jgi:hypothetical protein